jgi:two-component system sensor histidine kinase CiaH
VAVGDRGPGIPSEERQRVFERFYRSDHARASDGAGSGLGLSIAHSIVDLHHGSIEIRANEPSGCRVVVSLPHQPEVRP